MKQGLIDKVVFGVQFAVPVMMGNDELHGSDPKLLRFESGYHSSIVTITSSLDFCGAIDCLTFLDGFTDSDLINIGWLDG